MNTLRRIVVMALMALALPARAQEQQEDFDARPATDAADRWLAMVDAGRYGESWEAASPNFQEAIKRVQWEVAVQDARGKVGTLMRRKLRSAKSTLNPPNSPPGEYVVIQNDSVFSNRQVATETVTLMKQKDGGWRVAGYFIN
jgi:hypothetical protein